MTEPFPPDCYCGHTEDEHDPECLVEGCGCVHYEANWDNDE